MRTLKLTLAYDGTTYAGWQWQPGLATLQGTLEAAIMKITGEELRVTASGRTDAGVHALGQVIGFRTSSLLPVDVLLRALNAELPRDMAALDVVEVADGFHAIRDVVRKRYRYVIHDGRPADVFRRAYSWHYREPLDADTMHRAAQAWLGRHDFASFESSGSTRETSVRTVFDISAVRGQELVDDPTAKNLIVFEVEADGFLYNMVRTMVGTLIEIGRRERPESWAAEVMAACDRRSAGMTAPPQGLFLLRVEYREPLAAAAEEEDSLALNQNCD